MKKRVLHVSSGGLNPGGVSSVIFSIVESLKSSFDFDCVVFSRESERENEFKKYGSLHRIHCYPQKGKRNYFELITRPIKLYFGIRKICSENSFDVIHCHNQRDEWICLLAAKHMGVPIRIAHTHVTNSPKKKSILEKMYKGVSPFMLRKVATVGIGCSKLACQQFFDGDEYYVIPNAIDLNVYSDTHHSVQNEMSFIHVGRFTYAKNQEFVLETFSEIFRKYPNASLKLVGYGEPEEVKRLQQLIEKLDIEKNVEMIPGDTADIPSCYAGANYMIFPSRFEGFGIVLIEAQAMGIRCYVSENIQEEADLGLLTFLNLSDGPQKWAEYIVKDIQDNKSISINIQKLMQYGNDEVRKKYISIYNGFCSSGESSF